MKFVKSPVDITWTAVEGGEEVIITGEAGLASFLEIIRETWADGGDLIIEKVDRVVFEREPDGSSKRA